ncbi:hypothetical protein JB92DRAFT_3032396 [Gautieria morchelliformis]|nr:hypothetical protein JB92DRAFT_3032396 [Gautieria morchelliformis]
MESDVKPDEERMSCACSSEKKGRNLVVCIDGTSNQFGPHNTNVIELYSELIKDDDQLTYYNSGIGTYAKPSWKSWSYVKQVVDNKIDLAIAWNFEKIVIAAYRWLSQNYEDGDRIYLFGFSRGAYQVRALAGMIHKVGLVHKGNEEQIPFTYKLYADEKSKEYYPPQPKKLLQHLHLHKTPVKPTPVNMPERFKTTFSRENVRVHFIGVWDTVSSVGTVWNKVLPLTDETEYVCFFRHALALDECRVKYLPEYAHGGVSQQKVARRNEDPSQPAKARRSADLAADEDKVKYTKLGIKISASRSRIKEVWFPGTHSDIGGGNQLNPNLKLGKTPGLWMSYEAMSNGLQMRPTKVDWDWKNLWEVKESLTPVWGIFDWLPFKRLSYKDLSSTTYRMDKGHGRKMKAGQKIHASVAFCPTSYCPKAKLSPESSVKAWVNIIGRGDYEWWGWTDGFKDVLELDIFDDTTVKEVKEVIQKLKAGPDTEKGVWLHRLLVMSWSWEGSQTLVDQGYWIYLDEEMVQRFLCIEGWENDVKLARWIASFMEKCGFRNKRMESRMIKSLERGLVGNISEVTLSSLQILRWLLNGSVYRNDYLQMLFTQNDCTMISILQSKLTCDDVDIQCQALKVLAASMAHNDLRNLISNPDMIHTIQGLLANTLVASMNHSHLYDLISIPEMMSAIHNRLRAGNWRLQILGLETLVACLDLNDLHTLIFNHETISTIHELLVGEDEEVQDKALATLVASMDHSNLYDLIFTPGMISAIYSKLRADDGRVEISALQTIKASMTHNDLHSLVFNPQTISIIQGLLADANENVQCNALDILVASMNHSETSA